MITDDVLTKVIQQVQGKYYGKYRGTVVENKDPQHIGRLKLKVPSILGEAETDWALPCMPLGGAVDQGLFGVPEIDSQVWVEFEEGAFSKPIWTGTFWQKKDDTPVELSDDEPTQKGIKTISGHQLVFEDKQDEESIHLEHPKGAILDIDKNGTIKLTDANGSTLTLDAENELLSVEDSTGNSVTMDDNGTTIKDSGGGEIKMAAKGGSVTISASKIVIDGNVFIGGEGGEGLIKGTTFMALFNSHTHPTGVGPSGPPVVPGDSAISTKGFVS